MGLFILKWLITFSGGYGRPDVFVLKIITPQRMSRIKFAEFIVWFITCVQWDHLRIFLIIHYLDP